MPQNDTKLGLSSLKWKPSFEFSVIFDLPNRLIRSGEGEEARALPNICRRFIGGHIATVSRVLLEEKTCQN